MNLEDDLDSEETIQAISSALQAGGHQVSFLEGNVTLFDNLRKVKPDLCFNICEGHFGDGLEAQVPAMLEMLRIPYTGSQVLTLALALDKPMTKRVLAYHSLPTPPFQTFERLDEALDPDLRFPLFVKPSREGTGMGVSTESIVYDVAGCLDLARVDFRLDANDGDKPYILEVNPLLGLNPDYSDLCIEAAADGWRYEELPHS